MASLSVTFCLLDGFSNLGLACLMEPLRALRDQEREAVSWRVVTPTGQAAVSSSGLTITPDLMTDNSEDCDVFAVLSGYGFRQHANPETHRSLHRLAAGARALLGADAGVWLLASSGLLTTGRATIHWQELAGFSEAFPELDVTAERFIRDGRIWSCGGASTALDLMLDLIADRFGPSRAFSTSTLFLHDSTRGARSQVGAARLSARAPAPLKWAVAEMSRALEVPIKINDIARRCGVSERGLFRLFEAELGMPPGRYYQLMRLNLARSLAVETDLPLSQIALRTGFASGASLAKACRASFQTSLSQLRRGQRRPARGSGPPSSVDGPDP